MIVQCDKCSAKFRLDDSKVKEGGVKVRCSKCSNIFIVQKEAPAEEADFDSFLSGLMPPPQGSASGLEGGVPAASAATTPDELVGKGGAAEEVPPVPEKSPGGETSERDDFDLSEFAFEDQAANQEPSAAVRDKKGIGDDFVFGELDLGEGSPDGIKPEIRAGGEASSDEISFDEMTARPFPEVDVSVEGLDPFGASANVDAGSAAPVPDSEDVSLAAEPPEFSFQTEPVARKVPEAGTDDIFADTPPGFSFEPEASGPEPPVMPAGQKDGIEQPAPFDFSQFDFGDEVTEEAGVSGHLPDRRADTKERPVFDRISADTLAGTREFEEGLPPLSISSRRKGGSSLPITVTAACILLVLILAGGGFYYFKEGSAAFDKLGLGFMASWFGAEKGKEEGGVAVRNATGMFLVNKEAGELFAVTGEAVNNFSKPRASIQVKVTLFGAKGAPIAQKTAYCGNPLSRDQLVSLPLAKLETAMSNQFGDSLSNLAVQPGKGIPFVVVMTNVPKETVEFGVEVVGSTVASQ